MKLPPVSTIVAMTHPGMVIGNKGAMPWRLSRDLKRFKTLTTPSAVVMGPKTYKSIGKPLPGRLNIIITTQEDYRAPAKGVLVAHDPQQALELAAIHHRNEFFVIGGAIVYASFLPLTAHLFITYIKSNLKGDTHFPHWDKREWNKVWIEKEYRREPGDSFPTRFAEYGRKLKPLPKGTQINWKLPEKRRKRKLKKSKVVKRKKKKTKK